MGLVLMERLKISWLPMRVMVVLALCVSVALCGVVFYSLRQASPAGHSVATTSVSNPGVSTTASPRSSVLVKWTPTAQEAKKRSEALKMQAPIRPDEITQNTDEGAVATAKYAVDLYNYAFSTGKVEEYKTLCKGTHKSCATTPAAIQKLHADGGWVDEMHVTFTDAWVRKDVKDKVVVELWYYQTGGIEYLGDGSKVDVKQSKWAALVTLSYNGSSWQVEEIYGVPQ